MADYAEFTLGPREARTRGLIRPTALHINVAAEVRSLGVGAALIEAFAAQVAGVKAPGLHLVTNEGARNVRFYERCGFRVLATTLSHGTPVVFMGR